MKCCIDREKYGDCICDDLKKLPDVSESTGTAGYVAKCEGCGSDLTQEEVEPYGDGFCHAIPDGDSDGEVFGCLPCGPVYMTTT